MVANRGNNRFFANILGGRKQADDFAVEVSAAQKERDLNKGSAHGIPSTETKEKQAKLAREWANEDVETARQERSAVNIQRVFRGFRTRRARTSNK